MKAQALENLSPEPALNDHQHPRVEVDLKRLVLVVRGAYVCEVDLERCNDPAQLLDYLLQVSDKPWCDRALAGELLAAVETACRERFGETAQGVFCPFGKPGRVNWATGRRQGTRVQRDPARTARRSWEDACFPKSQPGKTAL